MTEIEQERIENEKIVTELTRKCNDIESVWLQRTLSLENQKFEIQQQFDNSQTDFMKLMVC